MSTRYPADSPLDRLTRTLKRYDRLDRDLRRSARRERRRFRLVALTVLAAALLVTIAIPPFRYPVGGRVSSRFFLRQKPESVLPLDLEVHDGMDIAAAEGAPVLASAPGIVTATGSDNVSGNWVRIRHLLGFTTFYAHMSTVYVRPGDLVLLRSLGPIGRVGSTGRSTGPHAHFELHLGKTAIPPLTFLIWHDIRRLLIGR